MAEMRFERFTAADIDHAGMISLFKGAEMQAALAETASGLADRANGIARTHHVNHGPIEGDAYEAVPKVLDRTAVAVVRPAGEIGALDQAIYHTLDAINH